LVEFKLVSDKQTSKEMLRELEVNARKDTLGLGERFAQHRHRPLVEHLDDFRRYLLAEGDGRDHVEKTCSRIRTVLDGCGFEMIDDLQAPPVVEFLADLRQPRPHQPLQQEVYTVKEVAGLLGVKLASIHRIAKRGQLSCTGRNRNKRFCREDVEALLKDRCKGIGAQTSNYYLAAVKQFNAWLVRNERTDRKPLEHLTDLNVEVDLRRQRRPLPTDEFARFVAAGKAGQPFRGLDGTARAVLYTFAANTGLRASEIGSLLPCSFDLDARVPIVTVEAAYSKHRRQDQQPMRRDVAEMVRSYMVGRKPDIPLWPGTWTVAAAEMVRHDLAAAGLPYEVDGMVFDFHKLRHQFITNLVDAGGKPKDTQRLARHSTFSLTFDRYYSKKDITDVAEALDKLPALPTETDPNSDVKAAS
jgi:integrase